MICTIFFLPRWRRPASLPAQAQVAAAARKARRERKTGDKRYVVKKTQKGNIVQTCAKYRKKY
jgi:hypothetical protein